MKEIKWINCSKFIAICAVLLNHTNGILYTNYEITMGSFFSVSLFILLSGMTCFLSDTKHNLTYVQSIMKGCKTIAIAYLLATFVHQIVVFKYFDIVLYIQYVIHFNMGPFYYVMLYIQLMIANKIIYNLLTYEWKNQVLAEIISGIIILGFSSLTTNKTDILRIYGGGVES